MNNIKQYNKELLAARKRSLASFSGMEFRLASLGFINGVEWINDSKASDLESTHYALSLFKQPVNWIVQSSTLEKDYSIFEEVARYNIKSIICFGMEETNIKYALAGIVKNYAHMTTLEEAVVFAKGISLNEEVVLFSPACPAGADFSSYKDRGIAFDKLVAAL